MWDGSCEHDSPSLYPVREHASCLPLAVRQQIQPLNCRTTQTVISLCSNTCTFISLTSWLYYAKTCQPHCSSNSKDIFLLCLDIIKEGRNLSLWVFFIETRQNKTKLWDKAKQNFPGTLNNYQSYEWELLKRTYINKKINKETQQRTRGLRNVPLC